MSSAPMFLWTGSGSVRMNFGAMCTCKSCREAALLYQKQLSRLIANTSLNLSGDWVEKVDFAGEPVKLVIH